MPETKDLIAGYWLIQINSKEEAIDWAKRCPSPHGEGAEGEIELRQVFELEDFGPSPAIEDARRLESGIGEEEVVQPGYQDPERRRSAELGKNAVGLEECGASFEASLCEAPQDEAFSQCH